MDELTTITEYIQQQAGDEAEVIFGHGVDSHLGDRIRVTVIATGFASEGKIAKKLAEKKVHELDRTQISLFNQSDNSVNQRTAEIELKLKDDKDRPILEEKPTVQKPVVDKPVQRPQDKPILNKPEEPIEERTYVFQ